MSKKATQKEIKNAADFVEQPLVDETPLAKQIREAAEKGEKLSTKSDADVRTPDAPEKNPYEELDEIYSTNIPLKLQSFGGNESHEVYVMKCKMKDMGKVIRFAKTLMGEVSSLQAADAGDDISEQEQTSLILAVLENNLEQTYDLVYDLCSITNREDLDALDMDDGVELIMAIVEVNKRFFMQKVIPLIASIMGRNT